MTGGLFLLAGCQKSSPPVSNASITIVAAENFYGSVAREIAGDSANVTSILTNPNQDPHEFTPNAETARAIGDATMVIYNGLGYDDWIPRLIAAAPKPGRIVICVADLLGAEPATNPHVWYDPRTMPALAERIARVLDKPRMLARFQQGMDSLTSKINEIRSQDSGISIAATEPLFDDMAAALGLIVLNNKFQLAVMNGTEPDAQTIAEFETTLRAHKVKLLIYNSQVTNPASERMRAIATESGIPVAGVTETEPAGTNYLEWMLAELNAIEIALNDQK